MLRNFVNRPVGPESNNKIFMLTVSRYVGTIQQKIDIRNYSLRIFFLHIGTSSNQLSACPILPMVVSRYLLTNGKKSFNIVCALSMKKIDIFDRR